MAVIVQILPEKRSELSGIALLDKIAQAQNAAAV